MYGGTAKDKISAHLQKSLKGNLKNDTKYAVPVPNINVNIKTKINKVNEFKIYSIKKVFFNIS